MTSESVVKIDESRGTARVEVDPEIHARDAVLGAAYVFIDRCYVWLDKTAEGKWVVELRVRDDETAPGDLAGQFGNELLAQSVRATAYANNGSLIQAIVNRALVGAGARGGGAQAEAMELSELEALDLEDEPFDDPLGIAMSWEQKYGKKSPNDDEPGGSEGSKE